MQHELEATVQAVVKRVVVEVRVPLRESIDDLPEYTGRSEHGWTKAGSREEGLHLVAIASTALRRSHDLQYPLIRALVFRREGMRDTTVAEGVQPFPD